MVAQVHLSENAAVVLAQLSHAALTVTYLGVNQQSSCLLIAAPPVCAAMFQPGRQSCIFPVA